METVYYIITKVLSSQKNSTVSQIIIKLFNSQIILCFIDEDFF